MPEVLIGDLEGGESARSGAPSGQEPPEGQSHRDQPDDDPEDDPHRQVRPAHTEFGVALLLRWIMMLEHGAFSLGRGLAYRTSRMRFSNRSYLHRVRHSLVNRSIRILPQDRAQTRSCIRIVGPIMARTPAGTH